jgi:PRTRC genetic system protein E
MFQQLVPLLRQRSVLLTVTLVEDDQVRVNVMPKKLAEGENNALTTPMSFTGTAAELDEQLPAAISSFVASHLQLKNTLTRAEEEMDAAAKAAQEEARNKSKSTPRRRLNLPRKTSRRRSPSRLGLPTSSTLRKRLNPPLQFYPLRGLCPRRTRSSRRLRKTTRIQKITTATTRQRSLLFVRTAKEVGQPCCWPICSSLDLQEVNVGSYVNETVASRLRPCEGLFVAVKAAIDPDPGMEAALSNRRLFLFQFLETAKAYLSVAQMGAILPTRSSRDQPNACRFCFRWPRIQGKCRFPELVSCHSLRGHSLAAE